VDALLAVLMGAVPRRALRRLGTIAAMLLMVLFNTTMYGFIGTAPVAAASQSANSYQCDNGPVKGLPSSKQPCAGSNTAAVTVDGTSYKNYDSGNSNGLKSHWQEGQFISYRVVIVAPPGNHLLDISWDTVVSSLHAIDYMGSFDATETTSSTQSTFNYNHNNPCQDLVNHGDMAAADCPAGPPPFSAPWPGTSAGVGPLALTNCGGSAGSAPAVSAPGNVGLYGPPVVAGDAFHSFVGTITYQNQNLAQGSNSCSSGAEIPFTVEGNAGGAARTVVLTFGGHIASFHDWGAGNSATTINGSPYHLHMGTLDGASTGSQDLQLATTSVFFPTAITTSLTPSSVHVGQTAFDTATVTGAAPVTSGDSVAFTVYSNNTCTIAATTGSSGQILAQPTQATFVNNNGTITATSSR
jgi:hypothetical protein